MRLLTPPSSRQGASPATRDLSPGDKLRTSRTSPLSRSDLVLWHSTAQANVAGMSAAGGSGNAGVEWVSRAKFADAGSLAWISTEKNPTNAGFTQGIHL